MSMNDVEIDDIEEAMKENGYAAIHMFTHNGKDAISIGYFTTDSKKPEITSPIRDHLNSDGITIDWDLAAEFLKKRLASMKTTYVRVMDC